MNADLADFAHTTEAVPVPDAASQPAGPCRHCSAHATAECLRCAAAVCARHHHVMYGLCTGCTQDPTEEADDARPDLDIPWIG